MKPLTDRAVASLKPRAKRYQVFDGTCPGLSIRVFPSGGKSWVWQYREHVATDSGYEPGRRTRFWTLGNYPAVTLREARTITDRARSRLKANGIDPAVGKREARHAQSFGELAADYIQRHARPRKKSWKEDQRMLRVDVLPGWSARHVKAITRRDVYDLLDRIVDRGTLVTANRVSALVSTVLEHGKNKGWLDSNPAARIPKQKEKTRNRVLTDEELTGFWRVLDAIRTGTQPTPLIYQNVARGLQFMLRTGQRGGEIFTMEWSEVDEASGWWTIPVEHAKNGEEHRVPLTKAALQLIVEARRDGSGPNGWVFAGPQGGSLKVKAAKAISLLRKAGLLTDDPTMVRYWRHDVRRTVSTGMESIGVAFSTISKVMNHVDAGPRATRIYARHDYDPEKRQALETWGRHLDALLHGTTSRVVSGRFRK
jgi:integrase